MTEGRGELSEGHAPGGAVHRVDDHERHVVPARVQTFGMWIFLVGLTIIFSSSMLIYILLRLRAQDAEALGGLRPALTNFKLFTSTAIVLLASVSIHVAVLRIRREKRRSFLKWLIATDVLAVLFITVQTPAMIELLRLQPAPSGEMPSLAQGGAPTTQLFKFLFVLVLLHAAHVAGGAIYLAIVSRRALAGRYDHEHYTGVKHAAMYWHFLDLVWLTMFGTFLVLG